jgi:hypothetical protein
MGAHRGMVDASDSPWTGMDGNLRWQWSCMIRMCAGCQRRYAPAVSLLTASPLSSAALPQHALVESARFIMRMVVRLPARSSHLQWGRVGLRSQGVVAAALNAQ